jgi:hypothetical protein
VFLAGGRAEVTPALFFRLKPKLPSPALLSPPRPVEGGGIAEPHTENSVSPGWSWLPFSTQKPQSPQRRTERTTHSCRSGTALRAVCGRRTCTSRNRRAPEATPARTRSPPHNASLRPAPDRMTYWVVMFPQRVARNVRKKTIPSLASKYAVSENSPAFLVPSNRAGTARSAVCGKRELVRVTRDWFLAIHAREFPLSTTPGRRPGARPIAKPRRALCASLCALWLCVEGGSRVVTVRERSYRTALSPRDAVARPRPGRAERPRRSPA